MGLQNIVNICDSIEINRRKMVGIQFTRNELPRVTETPSYNPWRMTLTVPARLRYSDSRQILETIDTIDRRTPENVTFGTLGTWMFGYQGSLTPIQRSNVTYNSFIGNQLVLNVSGITGATSTSVVLEQGDFIQVSGYPYPFTSTTQVLKGTGSTVTVTTHRPNILTTVPGNGTPMRFGSDVIFNMFCPNMPTYKLMPGGSKYSVNGVLLNNAYVQWSDNFVLHEWVAAA